MTFPSIMPLVLLLLLSEALHKILVVNVVPWPSEHRLSLFSMTNKKLRVFILIFCLALIVLI